MNLYRVWRMSDESLHGPYVDSVVKKKDKHSCYVLEALDLPELEEVPVFRNSRRKM